MDYSKVLGLSTEERDALERVKPESVGMARRIEGVTPAGTLRLLMHVRKSREWEERSEKLLKGDDVGKDEMEGNIMPSL